MTRALSPALVRPVTVTTMVVSWSGALVSGLTEKCDAAGGSEGGSGRAARHGDLALKPQALQRQLLVISGSSFRSRFLGGLLSRSLALRRKPCMGALACLLSGCELCLGRHAL